MIFDQNAAINAFQKYMDCRVSTQAVPRIIGVRVTRSGKFIVSVAQPEAVAVKSNPEQPTSNRQVAGSNPVGNAKVARKP